jgi:aspartate ammonia-lyase
MARSGGKATRLERDAMGAKRVPAGAYYGVQTLRAMESFRISGVPVSRYPELVRGLALIKLAAARANHELGGLPARVLAGIEAACRDLIAGRYHDQFQVDVFQGGGGTSTNMAANEVIANIALEHMGERKGDYLHCDPHDHVNMSQSTNDAYPSALRIALLIGNERLHAVIKRLAGAFRARGKAFAHVVKVGRTHLQDAVPMTLGQEFEAFARTVEDEARALLSVERALAEIHMGGTAIGTGLNAPRGFGRACARHLTRLTGRRIRLAPDLIEATQDTQAFVMYSSALRSVSIKLSKVCNDLRLLASGPRAGLSEIHLPAVQPGSSIMPGKVNPVIPEVVNQVCFAVLGNDLAVSLAAQAGQLQLNVMEPVIASRILESQTLLSNAARTLRELCVDGITANPDECRRHVERSLGIVTALNPYIGYDKATELASLALRTGKGIVELVREKRLLTDAQIARILDPSTMTGRGAR